MSNSLSRKSFVFGFLLVFSFVTLLAGCSAGPQEPDQPGPTVTTTIYGQVVDEGGMPVAGASVTSSSVSTTTDANGLFILKDAVVPQSRLVVLAKKAGYFTSARAETPKAGGATRTKLFLMPNASNYTVNASSGGTVNVTGGASVKFEAGSFRTTSGSTYSGTVQVAARYLDPANPSFADYFAGDNLAQNASGDEVALISCGVLRVEMTGQNGEALTLDAAKPATISYPKPANNPSAPATMPLWYFDETLGMWKEEGSATLQSGKYVGTVTHFTDWNLDYKGETGTLEFRVVCNGVPIPGVSIKIEGFFYKQGYTDENGRIRFVLAPADKEITILIRPEDNGGLYYITTPVKTRISPNSVTDIGDITLNSPCPASISGTLVDCDGKPTEGLITFEIGSELLYSYTKTGAFALTVKSGVALVVKGTDVNGNESIPLDILPLLEGENRLVGDIKICGSGNETFFDIPLANHYYTVMALSPDGTRFGIAVLSQNMCELEIYETSTGSLLMKQTFPSNRSMRALQFSTDNKTLLSLEWGNYTVYDISGSSFVPLSSLTQTGAVCMYDDGSKVIAGVRTGQNYAYKLLRTTDGSLIKEIHPTINSIVDSMNAFTLIQDEDAIIYPDYNGNWHIWDVANDIESRSYALFGNKYGGVFSDDASVLALSADQNHHNCYSTKTGMKIASIEEADTIRNGTIQGIAISNNYGYSTYRHPVMRVQASKFSDGSSKSKLLSGVDYIYTVVVSRNDEYLAASHAKGVRVWKLK